MNLFWNRGAKGVSVAYPYCTEEQPLTLDNGAPPGNLPGLQGFRRSLEPVWSNCRGWWLGSHCLKMYLSTGHLRSFKAIRLVMTIWQG
jgi:hypothetical protein